MNKLVFLESQGVNAEPFTTSKIIAEVTGVTHKKIKLAVNKHKEAFETFGKVVPYGDTLESGQTEVLYRLNEQQATLLVTFLKNTPVVIEFKTELVRQFYAMRQILLQRKAEEWQQTRLQTKKVRLAETDAIKALISYAKEQGSQNADMLYISYSKLVKQLAGYDRRDTADVETLTEILTFERLLLGIITSEMQQNTHYKQIYQKAKSQLLEIKRLWAVPKLSA